MYTQIVPCGCITGAGFGKRFTTEYVGRCPICGNKISYVKIITEQIRKTVAPTIAISKEGKLLVGKILGERFYIEREYEYNELNGRVAREYLCTKYHCTWIDIKIINEQEIPAPKIVQPEMFPAKKNLDKGNY